MGSRCAEIYKYIQAYVDDAVTPAEERSLEAHIRACPACRARLVSLARTVNRLEEQTRIGVGADFTRRLMERLPDASPGTGGGWTRPRPRIPGWPIRRLFGPR